MTLYKTILEDIKRYTFVRKVELRNMYVYITYDNRGVNKTKKISYRASSLQLQSFILKIKKEIGYDEIKEKRDIFVRKEMAKPMMFVNTGEDDE